MQYPHSKIIVFAKAPVTGKVKTRLIPLLGEQNACELHRRMVQHTLDQATSNNLAPVELHCAPDIEHPYIQQLSTDYGISLQQQQGDDLGLRMCNALLQALESCEQVILVGSDCPVLDSTYLQLALETLDSGHELVLGPAEDGGYVLIGVKSHYPALFTDIDWGTDRVLKQTRDRIKRLGLKHHELETLWDVDTPEDLQRLRENEQLARIY